MTSKSKQSQKDCPHLHVNYHIILLNLSFFLTVHNSYFDQCTEGLVFKKTKCFKVQKDLYNWKQAVQSCNEKGGRIVTVNNDDFLKFVTKLAKDFSKTK